jgi:protein-S-isoprenylcysteine O-methyltransferase Ste14
VVAQFALGAGALAAGTVGPDFPRALDPVGVVLMVLGGVLFVWALALLGPARTPLPRPRAQGRLVSHGPYRIVRHPVYTAVLLFFAGYGLATTLPALAVGAALVVTNALKARYEEQLLLERFPEYADYRTRTRSRLVPWVY